MIKEMIIREQMISLRSMMSWFVFMVFSLSSSYFAVSSSFSKEIEGWFASENCISDRPRELPNKSSPPPLKLMSKAGSDTRERTRKSPARYLRRVK
jgi:hypothetical protein